MFFLLLRNELTSPHFNRSATCRPEPPKERILITIDQQIQEQIDLTKVVITDLADILGSKYHDVSITISAVCNGVRVPIDELSETMLDVRENF